MLSRKLKAAAAGVAMVGAAAGSVVATSQPADAASCYRNGNGTTECYVWHTAPSYYTGNRPTGGYLYAGWNYFYCQAVGSEYRALGYHNYWWLKTDDDNHHARVWVNAVYVSSGGNDQPIPGVPYC